MPLNLLTDRWIPVRRIDGSTDVIGPWEIVPPDGGAIPPPVDLLPPRPDFRAALHEFLIGLLQLAMPPRDDAAWGQLLDAPPSQEALLAALAPFTSWFRLDGDRPRFMQDLTLPEPGPKDELLPVASLLIDAPGAKTVRDNTDHFIKRDRVDALCLPCAAMALYTLQTFAPAGGAGIRTSLRGGGPMSTLAVPDDDPQRPARLWRTLWANVLSAPRCRYGMPSPDQYPGGVFPWGAPTRTSEKGETTSPQDVHPLHAYWGMPRRILLLPRIESTPCACSVCGNGTTEVVRQFVQRPSGYNYGPTWKHNLTPYRFQKGDAPALPLKGNPGVTGYTHWLGVVCGEGEGDGNIDRAACVSFALSQRRLRGQVRVRASGYDMENMKARQWCEGEYPVLTAEHVDLAEFRAQVKEMVADANTARQQLLWSLRRAMFGDKAQAKSDAAPFQGYAGMFWSETEAPFYEMVARLAEPDRAAGEEEADSPGELGGQDISNAETVRRQWAQVLLRTALRIYDTALEGMLLAGDGKLWQRDAQARGGLKATLYKRLNITLQPVA
ncbi:type I-E CRISPR-associated protein Cse1/CasA [Nitratidesulfovibrio sp. D1]|uniref:type I-E CRISPR-associated protein Cse1/CasA n=1 Tax=Nitratidesulfovibrio sp. D1 TaxID=3440151 RepID=UPI003EB9C888